MEMKNRSKHLLLGFSLIALLFLDLTPETTNPIRLVPEAAAIIGIPITPFSVAGVARRTTRREVAFAATAGAAASTSYAAAPPVPAAPPPAAPVTAHLAGAPPIGTIVTALPPGCVTSPHGGTEYYNCGGVYYRPAFQGSNLVYVVQNP
jgi:hypothetical protein